MQSAGDIFQVLLHQAAQSGARSTALRSLAWLVGMLLTSTLGAFWVAAPVWLGVSLCVCSVITVVAYLLAYGYLLFVDRDALRSESYHLKKIAIQKNLYGDSDAGEIEENVVVGENLRIRLESSDSGNEDEPA